MDASALLGGDVKEFLQKHGLSEYATAMVDEHGYDSMSLIEGLLDDSQLDALTDLVGMKAGHKIKFKALLTRKPTAPAGVAVVLGNNVGGAGLRPVITNEVMNRSDGAPTSTRTSSVEGGSLMDRLKADPYLAQFNIDISAPRDECCGTCCPCCADEGKLPPYDASNWRGRLLASEYEVLASNVAQKYSGHTCSRGCCGCCCSPSELEVYIDKVSESLRPRGVRLKVTARHVTITNGVRGEDAFRIAVNIVPI